MATTTTIAICGDIGSQYFLHRYQRKPFQWDFRRTAKFGLCGLLIAPQMVQWYMFLKRSFPDHSTRTAVKRLCVDQTVFSSYVLPISMQRVQFTYAYALPPVVTDNQICVHILARQWLYFRRRQLQRRTKTVEDQVVWLISSFHNVLASILLYHVHGDPATSSSVVDQRGVIRMVCNYFTQSAWMNDICHSMRFITWSNRFPFPSSSTTSSMSREFWSTVCVFGFSVSTTLPHHQIVYCQNLRGCTYLQFLRTICYRLHVVFAVHITDFRSLLRAWPWDFVAFWCNSYPQSRIAETRKGCSQYRGKSYWIACAKCKWCTYANSEPFVINCIWFNCFWE